MGLPEDDYITLICPACGQKNRTVSARIASAVCGRCNKPLRLSRRYKPLVITALILCLAIPSIFLWNRHGDVSVIEVTQTPLSTPTAKPTPKPTAPLLPASVPSVKPPQDFKFTTPSQSFTQSLPRPVPSPDDLNTALSRLRELQKQQRKEKDKEEKKKRAQEIAELLHHIIEAFNEGKHGDLPQPEARSVRPNQQSASIEIENGTGSYLSIFLTGPQDDFISISPSGTTTRKLLPGSYKIAARVAMPDVTPFTGEWMIERGGDYSHRFFIRTEYRRF